jgi:hypothetical protein
MDVAEALMLAGRNINADVPDWLMGRATWRRSTATS